MEWRRGEPTTIHKTAKQTTWSETHKIRIFMVIIQEKNVFTCSSQTKLCKLFNVCFQKSMYIILNYAYIRFDDQII